MASELHEDLAAFYRFVGNQLDNEITTPSPEECLELWRTQHPTPVELEESVAAVRRALDQADRGEGKTLEEFDRGFRSKHGIRQEQ